MTGSVNTDNSPEGDTPFTDEEFARFQRLALERMRWSTLSVAIAEISSESLALVRDLERFNAMSTVPLLAGLLTVPYYQANCVRIEVLVALAVVHCGGRKKANLKDVSRWFSAIGESRAALGEDPSEDVFVALVSFQKRDYMILEGIWEGAGFYTQRVLDVVSSMPNSGEFLDLKRSVHALLVVSNKVCEQSGLSRYELGEQLPQSTLSPERIPSGKHLAARVRVSLDELSAAGVDAGYLDPFVFDPRARASLLKQQVGASLLDLQPLLAFEVSSLVVALPSALSMTLREHVIAVVLDSECAGAFDDSLGTSYSRLFWNVPLFGTHHRALPRWKLVGDHRIAEWFVDVDRSHLVAMQFVLPSIGVHRKGGFKDPYEEEESLAAALRASADELIAEAASREHFKLGVFLRVSCGWGKGCSYLAPAIRSSEWSFDSISAADLVRLSWLPEMSVQYFWRVHAGLALAQGQGLHLINFNGILNLIGWVRSNDGHFVPHDSLPDGRVTLHSPLTLSTPTYLLRDVRAESDLAHDAHHVADNRGRRHLVMREMAQRAFSDDFSRNLYVSLDDVNRGTYTSLYEGHHLLWVTVTATGLDGDACYRLWRMVNEWLPRVGHQLDSLFKQESSASLKLHVDFLDHELPGAQDEKPHPDLLSTLCSIEEHSDVRARRVVFSPGFVDGFSIAENVAERLVTRMLVRAYLSLIAASNEEHATQIEEAVVRNSQARSFHLFNAHEFLDFVRPVVDRPVISIDTIDDAGARLGLGWKALRSEESGTIEGRRECATFLARAVRILCEEVALALRSADRMSVLRRLMVNNELAGYQERVWTRTSSALLGLYGETPQVRDRVVREKSKLAGAGMSSRVLIEMAICESPLTGGSELSDMEISRLIARVALASRLGGISDAIFYNALEPKVKVSPLGDILFRNDFGAMVVEPMLSKMVGDRFVSSSALQKKNYEEPEPLPESRSKIDPEFWDAWLIEMGFNLDEGRAIVGAIEDKGIADGTPIVALRRSEYILLASSDGIRVDVAERFLERFGLRTRADWETPPAGFSNKDLFPWRFGRRLSYVSRPILVTDLGDDPVLLIAPGFLRTSYAFMVAGAHSGRLDQSFFMSNEMRNLWWGKASEGHSFNSDVCDALKGAGWTTRENIGIPEVLSTRLDRDYGDVDVLAWKPGVSEILVVECKDLSPARNYSEIAALLADYQGSSKNGVPDKLRKHLDRVALLEKNLFRLGRFSGVDKPTISAWLVCSSEVPMTYAKISALSGTKVGGIEDIIGGCTQ